MVTINLKPRVAKRTRIGDDVANLLRRQIICGDIAHGVRVTEDGLAKDLKISRACVKEAFLVLEAEGLLTRRVRNKYTETVSFTDQDVVEIMSVRKAIELLCAETCLKNDTVPLRELRQQWDLINSLQVEEPDYIAQVEADLKFHLIAVEAACNGRALAIWKSLESQVKAMLFPLLNQTLTKIVFSSPLSHQNILSAFERKDGVEIARLLTDHIDANIGLFRDLSSSESVVADM